MSDIERLSVKGAGVLRGKKAPCNIPPEDEKAVYWVIYRTYIYIHTYIYIEMWSDEYCVIIMSTVWTGNFFMGPLNVMGVELRLTPEPFGCSTLILWCARCLKGILTGHIWCRVAELHWWWNFRRGMGAVSEMAVAMYLRTFYFRFLMKFSNGVYWIVFISYS